MKTPKNLKLIPREIELDIQAALDRGIYIMDNDPVISHFWIALQALFPEGERFFIDSARDVRDEYLEKHGSLPEELEQHLKDFIRQEAYHGAHHEDVNQVIVGLGYHRIQKASDMLRKNRKDGRKQFSALARLSLTAAGEHFTATIGRLQLHKDPDFFKNMDPEIQKLFMYHALEEIEHKAVCYDLYQLAGGGYFRRIMGLVAFSLGLMAVMRHMHVYMLKKDGLWNKETKRRARKEIWGRNGLVWKMLPDIVQYLKPGFHPWDEDDRTWLIDEYSDFLEKHGFEGLAAA